MLLLSMSIREEEPVTGLMSDTTDSQPNIFFFELDLLLSAILDSPFSLLLDRSNLLNFMLLLPLKLLLFISMRPLSPSSYLQLTTTLTKLVMFCLRSSRYFQLIQTEPQFLVSASGQYLGLRGGSFSSSISAGIQSSDYSSCLYQVTFYKCEYSGESLDLIYFYRLSFSPRQADDITCICLFISLNRSSTILIIFLQAVSSFFWCAQTNCSILAALLAVASSISFCASYFITASCSIQVVLVVIMFSILAGFLVYWCSCTWLAMHSGHSGSMQLAALQMLVIEYYWCEGQGIGMKPGALELLIDVISDQLDRTVILDQNILNQYFCYKAISRKLQESSCLALGLLRVCPSQKALLFSKLYQRKRETVLVGIVTQHSLHFQQLAGSITDRLYFKLMFDTSAAVPASPHEASIFSETLLKQLNELSLGPKASSETDTNIGGDQKTKNKRIEKNQCHRTHKKPANVIRKRQQTAKKIEELQNRIHQLQRENNSLRRQMESCSFCCHDHDKIHRRMTLDDVEMVQQEDFYKAMSEMQSRHSKQSVQFEAIDFCQSLAYKHEMDDKSWVMLGTLMIMIGSKNMDIDGTINTFRVLNNSVDVIRRQFEKSEPKICLDFYFSKEEMKENSMFMEGLDFDPFMSKHEKSGFMVQATRIETAEPFELVYDQKYSFSVNYESLIVAFERLKQQSWVSL